MDISTVNPAWPKILPDPSIQFYLLRIVRLDIRPAELENVNIRPFAGKINQSIQKNLLVMIKKTDLNVRE